MARKVWVIPASAQIDDATIAAASAAACTEIAVAPTTSRTRSSTLISRMRSRPQPTTSPR